MSCGNVATVEWGEARNFIQRFVEVRHDVIMVSYSRHGVALTV